MLLFWTLVATGILYGLLALWRLSISAGHERALPLAAAFAGMSIWAFSNLTATAEIGVFGQLIRSFAWLGYLAFSVRGAQLPSGHKFFEAEIALAGIAIIAAAATVFAAESASADNQSFWVVFALAARLTLTIGGIVYLHSLYSNSDSATGSGFRVVVVSLAILWAYDLNLYTVTLLGYSVASSLMAGRPVVALLLFPAFAIAARRREHWRIALSRKVTFQSLSLMAIGLYFVTMSLAARAVSLFTGAASAVVAIGTALIVSALGATILFVPRYRAWLKVIVSKHLFSHRYDYRSEWLRFSATIAEAKESSLALEERVVKAIAEVTESPSGLLLQPSRDDRLDIVATWCWQHQSGNPDQAVQLPSSVIASLREGHIAALSQPRKGRTALPEREPLLDWASEAWVAVPLIRLSSLIGVVVLTKPPLERELDWEDFDLLKAIGHQAAVHISDTQNQSELEEARRFEEFNRRFSYIIHDIKNVVSQLSLVASNAEQHGSNPKFQTEMNRSLASAVQKMTLLLTRLSPDRVFQPMPLEAIDVDRMIAAIVSARTGQHAMTHGAASGAHARGDLTKLQLAIDHLVQNAIEASPADEPVVLASRREEGRCCITIVDRAAGMSADFIRKGLFKPFVSTKGGGFGIGAAEAKALVEDMGGKLRVSSIEGQGSTFTIELPLDDSRTR